MFGVLTVIKEPWNWARAAGSRLQPGAGISFHGGQFRMAMFRQIQLRIPEDRPELARQRVLRGLTWLRQQKVSPVLVPEEYEAQALACGLEPVRREPALQACAGQIAEQAARALGLSPLEGTSPFADCADGALLALAEQGILEGVRQDGVLCYLPEDLLTRSQISAIVWRQLRWKDAHPEAPTGGDPKAETPAESTQAPKILYREELLDVWEGVPVNTYQAESFYLENGRMQTRDEGLRLVQGIDVSAHQGVIDWKQVAGDGVEFAILRAGYRGYTVGNVKEDKMFSLNLAGAKKEGLSVGVYFFSQAITPAEALEEAELVLKLLDGCPLELPVVYDWENINDKDARTNGLDQETLTACARAFCDRVAQAGYQPMLYVIQHWAYKRYDLSRLADIPLWFAQYQEQPDFYYDFKLWQYTSKGSVRGIQGNVDRDVLLLRTN